MTDFSVAQPTDYAYLAKLLEERALTDQDNERVNEALVQKDMPIERYKRVRDWLESKPEKPKPKIPKAVPPKVDLANPGALYDMLTSPHESFEVKAPKAWSEADGDPVEDMKAWAKLMKEQTQHPIVSMWDKPKKTGKNYFIQQQYAQEHVYHKHKWNTSKDIKKLYEQASKNDPCPDDDIYGPPF